jgi:UTP--glucose-1-phosphate uridylyltransferase
MIKKAVLPVAGFGTRFLPASKAIPKEMLPIIDKPLLQYAVEEAINIGVDEIIFITSPEKYSIKKHFDKNTMFESRLKILGKTEMIKKLNPEVFHGIKFHYIDQKEQNGLGHAILQAQEVIGDDPFAVLLPDDLFFSKESCLDQLLISYQETNASVIAVNKVNKEDINKYGVIKPGEIKNKAIQIEDIVEKPSYENAPSDIAVCGRYILKPSIFKFLNSTNFDESGEIQLTDAIKALLVEENVYARIYDGEKYDCGSKKGFVHATIALALKDESISKDIQKIIKEII